MLKSVPILNPRLLALLAGAGHTDLIVIADAGLPRPRDVEVIHLSLVPGVPSFLQVLDAVRAVLQFERVMLARETRDQPLMRELGPRLEGIPIDEMSHEQFKERTRQALAIVRTGECSPYANLGLIAGVTF